MLGQFIHLCLGPLNTMAVQKNTRRVCRLGFFIPSSAVVMLCHALLWYSWLLQIHAEDIVLGALGAWTEYSPDLLISLIAADIDFRKNIDVATKETYGLPIIDMPERHNNLSQVKLWIGTTHASARIGVATALDMMLGLDGNTPVIGLIGASTSSVSQPIATMSAVQKVPQISFSATALALSNKELYPFFLRTLPPDSLQALVLWNLILTFEIPSATCIYTLETYGEQLFHALTTLQQGSSVLAGQALPFLLGDSAVTDQHRVARAAKAMGSRFIVLLLSSSMTLGFLRIMEQEDMLGPGWQVLGSDTMNFLRTSNSGGPRPPGFMYIDFVARGSLFSEFENLWSKLQPEDITSPEARDRYQLDKMREPLEDAAVAAALSRGSSHLSTYAAFAFDAYYAFLIAINNLLQRGVAAKGDELLEELRRTQFMGVSGDVSFDENGDRMSSYELWNLQNDTFESLTEPIAVLTAEFSVSTQNLTLYRDFAWMDGSIGRMPPRSLIDCDPGLYKSPSRQCQPCPKGVKCSGGQFQNCPRGTFANVTGSTDCMLCSPGFYAGDVGSANCNPCPPGYEAPNPGMEACRRCDSGTYMPFPGGVKCFPCGKNQVTEGRGAENQSECTCPQGSFMCESDGCVPCPSGLECPGGLGAPLQSAGYWTQATSRIHQCDFAVLRCRNTLECPLGQAGSCASGREGIACNDCKKNHFPFNGDCKQCDGKDLLPTLFFVTFVVLVLISLSCVQPDSNQLSALARH